MILQIDQLFINADNIVTISPYNTDEKDKMIFGLIINGVKYVLYVVSKEDQGEVEKTAKKILNIVSTIINSCSVHPVQRLNLEEKEDTNVKS